MGTTQGGRMNRREHRKEGDGLEGYEMPNKWVSATRTRTDLLCNIQPTLFSTGVTEPNHYCFCVPSFSHFTALLRIDTSNQAIFRRLSRGPSFRPCAAGRSIPRFVGSSRPDMSSRACLALVALSVVPSRTRTRRRSSNSPLGAAIFGRSGGASPSTISPLLRLV